MVTYLDAFGNVLGQATYQKNVVAVVGPPRQAGGVRESSPINLFIGPNPPSATGEEGQLELHSAVGFTDPQDGREFLAQYWTLSLSGTALSGTLTDTHEAEALALNLLNTAREVSPGVVIVWPDVIATGATLNGTVSAERLSLRLEGNVSTGDRPFVADITATRLP